MRSLRSRRGRLPSHQYLLVAEDHPHLDPAAERGDVPAGAEALSLPAGASAIKRPKRLVMNVTITVIGSAMLRRLSGETFDVETAVSPIESTGCALNYQPWGEGRRIRYSRQAIADFAAMMRFWVVMWGS